MSLAHAFHLAAPAEEPAPPSFEDEVAAELASLGAEPGGEGFSSEPPHAAGGGEGLPGPSQRPTASTDAPDAPALVEGGTPATPEAFAPQSGPLHAVLPARSEPGQLVQAHDLSFGILGSPAFRSSSSGSAVAPPHVREQRAQPSSGEPAVHKQPIKGKH